MPDENVTPPAPPLPQQHEAVGAVQNMPAPSVRMSATRANRLAWTAIILAIVGIVAGVLAIAGWLPELGRQIASTVALICQAVSIYLARITPSAQALSAAQQNGHAEVAE